MLVKHNGEYIQSVCKYVDPLAQALEDMPFEEYVLLVLAIERKEAVNHAR